MILFCCGQLAFFCEETRLCKCLVVFEQFFCLRHHDVELFSGSYLLFLSGLCRTVFIGANMTLSDISIGQQLICLFGGSIQGLFKCQIPNFEKIAIHA